MAMKPRRITRCGFAFGSSLGTPAANSSSISESGSRRMPVATADIPSATDRNSGTTKKIPAWTRNRKKNEVTPLRSWMLRSIFGSISAACAARDPPVLPQRRTVPAPRRLRGSSQITGESPSHSGASGLGCTNPHAPDLQDADHDQAEARAPTAPCRPGRAGRPSRPVCRSPAASERGSRARSAPRRRTPTATRRRS